MYAIIFLNTVKGSVVIKELLKLKKLVGFSLRTYSLQYLKCLFYMVVYSVASLVFPSIISLIIDNGITGDSAREITIYCFVILFTGAIMVVFYYIQRVSFFRLSQKIIIKIKNSIYGKLLRTNLQFWNEHQVGDVFTVLESDVSKLESLFTTVISDAVVNFFTIISISGILILIDPFIGISVLLLSVVFIWIQKKVGNRVKDGMTELRAKIGELTSFTNETLNNMSNIQIMGLASSISKKYEDKNTEVIKKHIEQIKLRSLAQVGAMSFNVVGIFAVLIIGSFKVADNLLTVGTLFSLTMYVQRLYGPIISLGDTYLSIKNIVPTVNKILDVLETDELIPEGKVLYHDNLDGSICFDNITFAYKSKERKQILNKLNFTIHPGKTLGIVGKNGSGKTTVIRLLSKLCQAQYGQILIDNVDVNDFDIDYLSSQIGYMPQNGYLLSGSLKEALTFGINNVNDERILQLIRAFNFDINRFLNSMDADIGENKANISGGEAQKISLIRLFLEDKPIYILDEPTSAIDSKSEDIICNSLKKLLAGKTAIIITHRPKILEICDDIFTMEGTA